MRRVHSLVALCVLALIGFGAHAGGVLHGLHHPDVVSKEIGIETSSDLVLLPGSEIGSITVNHCAQCRSATYSVSRDTQYFIGSQKSTLAELRHNLVPGESRFMMVYVAVDQPVVNRIVLFAAPGASRTRR